MRSVPCFLILGVLAAAVAHAQKCPERSGYIAKQDTNWAGSSKTQESQTSPQNAEQICNLDSNCLAFNNYGYYILKKDSAAQGTIAGVGIQLAPYDGMCTYIKASALPPQCPDKAGYLTKADTNWVGTANTQESQTKPENAEQICKLDSNCLAFNNYGYYILKKSNAPAGISFQPYKGMCTYIRATAAATGGPTISQQPTVVPPAPKQYVFANPATKLCFAVNDAERLPLGMPRLLLASCSAADATQAFKVIQVPGTANSFQIVDNKGRCVTTYSGLLIDAAALMPCGRSQSDQQWSINSVTPNGKGPYTIRSKSSGDCLVVNYRKMITLDDCNPNDPSSLFQSAAL